MLEAPHLSAQCFVGEEFLIIQLLLGDVAALLRAAAPKTSRTPPQFVLAMRRDAASVAAP